MSADLPLSTVLERIDAWYLANVPAIHATLRPPASDAELDALAEATGLILPQAFRMLYRWHDGQDWAVGGVFGLDFQSLESVQRAWNVWKELALDAEEETEDHVSYPPDTITERYINIGWLGFLSDGGGNSVGVDFDPGPAGEVGQIITFGRDEYYKYVLAQSLDAFLHEYESRLAQGYVEITHPDGDGSHSVDLLETDWQPSAGYGIACHFPSFGPVP